MNEKKTVLIVKPNHLHCECCENDYVKPWTKLMIIITIIQTQPFLFFIFQENKHVHMITNYIRKTDKEL